MSKCRTVSECCVQKRHSVLGSGLILVLKGFRLLWPVMISTISFKSGHLSFSRFLLLLGSMIGKKDPCVFKFGQVLLPLLYPFIIYVCFNVVFEKRGRQRSRSSSCVQFEAMLANLSAYSFPRWFRCALIQFRHIRFVCLPRLFRLSIASCTRRYFRFM